MTPLVEARGLTKKYKNVRALDDLDLVASDGHVVALLGPNGAGKTTFVRVGRHVAAARRRHAARRRRRRAEASERSAPADRARGSVRGRRADDDRSGEPRDDRPAVRAPRPYGARRTADAVLERLGLVEAADRRVKTYSGGMRRKLDLGASLVGAPKLLLLDEPTTGLDPRSRIELWDTIRDLVSTGTDVLLTTQYLDEADQLAQEIVIIDHGRVIAAGTPDELKSRAGQDVVEIHARDARVARSARERARTASVTTIRASTRERAGSRSRSTTGPSDSPTPSASSATSASRSTTSHCADRLSTRCSSRSPASRRPNAPTTTDENTDERTPTRTKGRLMQTMTAPAAHSITAPERTAGPTHDRRRGRAPVPSASSPRSPQLAVVGTIQGAMFLLIFRYVFGGAINTGHRVVRRLPRPRLRAHRRAVRRIERGVGRRRRSRSRLHRPAAFAADPAQQRDGRPRPRRHDHRHVGTPRSRPRSASRSGSGCTRASATRSAAFGLCIVAAYAFSWVFIYIGLVSGTAQAAQGISLLVFPLTFVSSALRAGREHARLDAAVRPAPADHGDGRRGPFARPRGQRGQPPPPRHRATTWSARSSGRPRSALVFGALSIAPLPARADGRSPALR